MSVLNNFFFRSFMISEGLQFFWKKLFSRVLWPSQLGPSETDCAFRKYNLQQLHFSSVKSSDFPASDRLVTSLPLLTAFHRSKDVVFVRILTNSYLPQHLLHRFSEFSFADGINNRVEPLRKKMHIVARTASPENRFLGRTGDKCL